MPDQRPIEKLLKDYADQRQAEAGPPGEMPPATRQRLQAEVRRNYPPPESTPSWFQSLLLAWPRLIPALGIFLVLGILSWVLFRSTEPSPATLAATGESGSDDTLAPAEVDRDPEPLSIVTSPTPSPGKTKPVKQKKEAPLGLLNEQIMQQALAPATAPSKPDSSALAGENASAATDTFAPTPRLKESEPPTARFTGRNRRLEMADATQPLSKAISLTKETGSTAERVPTPSAAPISRPAREESVTRTVTSRAGGDQNVVSAAATRPPGDTAVESQEAAIATVTTAFTNTIEDARLAAVYGTASTRNGFLNSFKVSQSGNTVRFVDADGSVYSGKLTSPETLARGRAAVQRQVAPVQSAELGNTASGWASAPYFFRISGTNLTLNREIIISGTLAVSNSVPAATEGYVAPPQPVPSEISGTAHFSPTETIRVKARPVTVGGK